MKRFAGTLLFVFIASMLALGQTTSGKLIGTVSDATGAVAGATVVITDGQTGRERTVTSDSSGNFTVPLEFGTYTVKVTAAGFKGYTATDVKIDAGREYPLNVVLEIGAVTEEVTVTAGAEDINSTNGELATTVSPQQIKELPLNGRNPLSLLNLQAGVNATSGSINGQRTSSVNYTRDGLNVQDNFIRNGFVSDQPTVDDTGEFTVITANAGADQGQGGSTQVQLVTPRGGSQFHGALYEFNRNSEFAANPFLSNTNSLERPFLNRNQFGGSISGPIPIFNFGENDGPVFIKKKAFFFFNYEGFRLANQVPVTGLTTLLPAAQGGNFTYVGTDGVTRTVNVLSGTGLDLSTPSKVAQFTAAGGMLGIDPLIQTRILSTLPAAGTTTTFTGINFLQGYALNRSNPEERNGYTFRFDGEPTDRHSFSAVYKRNNIVDARTDIGAGFRPITTVSQGGPTNFFAAAYRTAIGSSFSNEFRAGFQYSKPFFFNTEGIPSFLLTVPLISNPNTGLLDQGRNTLYKNFQDNAVWTWGNHSFRFGGGLDTYNITALNYAGTIPTYTIASTANAATPGFTNGTATNAGVLPNISNTDLARANNLRYLLAGIVSTAAISSNLADTSSGYQIGAPSVRKLNFEIYSAYVADQWRLRPNLTLNLGIRYDLYTPINDPRGLYLEPVIHNFDNPVADILNPAGTYNFVGGNAGSPGDFFKTDKNNFGPSISVAWSPMFSKGFIGRIFPESTVVRGGFRISYVNDEYVRSADNALLNNLGLGTVTQTQSGLHAALTPRSGFVAPPAFTTAPTFVPPPRTYLQNNSTGVNGSVVAIDPNLQNQKIYEYNVGIQREIGFKTVFEVRYVGNFSNDLVRTIDYNQIRVADNGYLPDFLRAQNNCRLQAVAAHGPTIPTGADPIFYCDSAAYNPAIAGSQQLPFFAQLGALQGFANGGVGTTAASNPNLLAYLGFQIPADFANSFLIPTANNVTNAKNLLLNNPSTFVANLTVNGGKLRYNALQAELRRRFSDGLSLQANYTFQKILTDIPTAESDQTRVSAYLDNNNKGLDYSRAQYDRTHTFNFNAIYELPFGKGKKFLNDSGPLDWIFGGLQMSSIVTLSSGVPVSILDNSGTLNRGGRSTWQSATSTLSAAEIKQLTGVFKTPNGVFGIDPSVLYATGSNGLRVDLNQPLPVGVTITSIRAAADPSVGTGKYAGQVFFYNNAGTTGNLPRNFINGPKYINWDAGLSKNIKFGEARRLQLRWEVFNVLNHANFFATDLTQVFNVNNTTDFGKLKGGYAPRIMQFGARFDF
ncbi:MAG: carboxypeptidase regulatory-like domain-containing protein [Pyrinomonadaceae bacterium]